MLLKDALKSCNTKVKIGSLNGTAYVYVGDVTCDTIANLVRKSLGGKRKIARKMDNLKKQIDFLVKNGEVAVEQMDQYRELSENLENWQDIPDREVVETFVASEVVEPITTTVFMVNGYEDGAYWMCDELGKRRGIANGYAEKDV